MDSKKNTDFHEAGFFVLPGPLDLGKIRPGGRGMPLGKDMQTEVREVDNMRDPIFSEILTRLQGVEDAVKQREEAFTNGINAFTEMVVSVLVEEWQLALQEQKRAQEEQEKRYLAAMRLLLEQSVQTGEKPDSGQPASWLGRLFDNKNRA